MTLIICAMSYFVEQQQCINFHLVVVIFVEHRRIELLTF